jgi:hypothetical protein
MATSAIKTGLDKLNAVLKEMGAWCYCESTPVSHGCITTLKHYYMPQSKTHVIVEVQDDGGFGIYAPLVKSNDIDSCLAALKAL